jgi:hypothetical protein
VQTAGRALVRLGIEDREVVPGDQIGPSVGGFDPERSEDGPVEAL